MSQTAEEEIADIDLTDPELAAAASKIQAGFRGHKTRKVVKKEAEPEKVDEELADIDLTDPELADAALRIQAGFRGHKIRKEKKKTEIEQEINKKMEELNVDDEELDIDLSDPELNKAATLIQASFRGHKVRKEGE